MTWLRRFWQRGHLDYVLTRHVEFPRRTGSRLVLVTDLHARDDWLPAPMVQTAVDHINAVEGADAVVLVGDFVGDDATAIDWAAPLLGGIEAPAYATLGNHDHWSDPVRVSDALESAGIPVLTNRSVQLPSGLHLAGIDSCWGGNPDPDAALAGIAAEEPTVVLGHEPHLATMHDRWLHLAGHTHRGQVQLRALGQRINSRTHPRFSKPYPGGRYDLDGRHVYTSSGIGYSTVNFRLFVPPEIVVVDV